MSADLDVLINATGAKTGQEAVSRALDAIKRDARQTAKEMDNVGDVTEDSMGVAVSAVKSFAAAVAGGLSVGLIANSFLDASVQAENFKIRLNVLLGSVSEGNRLFQLMSEYASQVPFQYNEIMASATQLAGIMRGGADEINEWMPLIGDLAAAAGLSIQDTTSQVQRMLSAGAASADMFRERGVLAMLGFQAGVSVSAEETKERLMAAWEDVDSQFRGAALAMADSWDGLMSMLGDKWFQFRQKIMDNGPFDFLKAIVMVLNDELGGALDFTNENAQRWGENIVESLRGVGVAVGWVITAFQGFSFLWKGLEIAWEGFKLAILEGIDTITGPLNSMIKALGGDFQIDGGAIALWSKETKDNIHQLNQELGTMLDTYIPGHQKWEEVLLQIEGKYHDLRQAAKATGDEGRTFNKVLETTDEKLAKIEARANKRLMDKLFPERAKLAEFEADLERLKKLFADDPESLQEATKRLIEQYQEWVDKSRDGNLKVKDSFKETVEEYKDGTQEMIDAIQGWGREFTSTITDAVFGAEVSFKELMESLARSVFEKQFHQNVTDPLMGIIGGGVESIFGSIFGGANTPPINPSLGAGGFKFSSLPGLATGGPALPNRSYLVGEDGPELLRMGGSGGFVTPLSGGSGGGHMAEPPVVNVQIVNQGTPHQVRDQDVSVDGARVLVKLILDDVHQGGEFSSELERTYGLARGG